MLLPKTITMPLKIFLAIYAAFIIEVAILFYAGTHESPNSLITVLMGIFVASAAITPFAFLRTWKEEEQ